MKRDISSLAEIEFDLIVVGGGMFGVCAAWDAALRGLSVAIVEKGDFCQATSANHYKMVHGGIRYLQHADFYRVRESSRERSALLRIAPHLVHPLPIVIPTYGFGTRGKAFLSAGFFLYELLTMDRNRGISDPGRRIPKGQFLTPREVIALFPGLPDMGLTGGAILNEGQYYNPPRIALSFLKSAVDVGAVAANYVEVHGFSMKGDRVTGVKVQDLLSQDKFEIRGKMVLVAGGPWSHRLLNKGLRLSLNPNPTFSRDLAFVVKRRMVKKYALACAMRTGDQDAILDRGGRHVFLSPWRDYTLVGVWHKVFNRPPEEISVEEKELQGYIDEVNNAYPAMALSLHDVSMINTGLTLFGSNEKQTSTKMSFGKRSRLIDHRKEHNIEGLITLIGVRATTARGMAEIAVNLVLKKLGKERGRSKTSATPIFGGKIDHFDTFLNRALNQRPPQLSEKAMTALVRNYGSEYPRLLSYADEDPSLLQTIGASTTIKAEIKYAVHEEIAQTLKDIVFRRTDLGTGGSPGEETLKISADLTAKELNWDAEKADIEFQEVKNVIQRLGFLT